MKATLLQHEKRKGGFLTLMIFALVMAYTEARKTFLVKMQHPTILAPKVQAYDGQFQIINIGNQYVAAMDYQVNVDVGFDFIQKQGTYKDKDFRFWSFRNNYYMKSELVTHPTLKLDAVYNGELIIELSKFRSNVFWEFIWFPASEDACIQVGFNSDPITFLLRSSFNLLQCYKVLVKTFTNWDQWDFNKMRRTGFFESCSASTSSTAQVFRWDFYDEKSDTDALWTNPIVFTSTTPADLDPANTPKPWCFWLPYYFSS